MKDYGFAKHQVPAEFNTFEDACYQAGVQWFMSGNSKLPRMAQVQGKRVPVVGSIGTPGQAFIRGWKQAKANQLAAA